YENVSFHYDQVCDENRVRLDEDEPEESHFRVRETGETSAEPRWVLRDLTFRVEPGQRVAFVGPSGCGKTTLASLLPRLFDVVDGRVIVDGVDVRDYALKSLRSAIAIVQQDSFLFSGTVRDNLLYGRPDATEE